MWGPSDYDHLQARGQATLGGQLNVAARGGFSPPVGAVFDVLFAGSFAGDFDSVQLPALDAGHWETGIGGSEPLAWELRVLP
jgi:hypothetical protein